MSERTPALKNRTFLTFWIGNLVSELGDGFGLVALPLLVLEATGSAVKMGMITLIVTLIKIFWGMIAGAIVDTVNRQKLVAACEIGRFAAFSAAALVWWALGPNVAILYALAVVGGFLIVTSNYGTSGLLTQIVDREELVQASSKMGAASGVAGVVGPLLGGLVAAKWGAVVALAVDGLSFLVFGLIVAAIRVRSVVLERNDQPSLRTLIAEGLSYLWGHPLLRSITVIMTVVATFLLAVDDVFVYRLRYEMKADADTVGLFYGALALSATAGSLVAGKVRARFGFGPAFLGGLLFEGLVLLVASRMMGPEMIVAGCAFMIAQNVRFVAMINAFLEATPDQLVGRVVSAFQTIATTFSVFGVPLATAVADRFGGAAALVLLGGVTAGMAITGLFTPARTRAPIQVAS